MNIASLVDSSNMLWIMYTLYIVHVLHTEYDSCAVSEMSKLWQNCCLFLTSTFQYWNIRLFFKNDRTFGIANCSCIFSKLKCVLSRIVLLYLCRMEIMSSFWSRKLVTFCRPFRQRIKYRKYFLPLNRKVSPNPYNAKIAFFQPNKMQKQKP